jgi:thiol-disulfide isomerase/thioredoxin
MRFIILGSFLFCFIITTCQAQYSIEIENLKEGDEKSLVGSYFCNSSLREEIYDSLYLVNLVPLGLRPKTNYLFVKGNVTKQIASIHIFDKVSFDTLIYLKKNEAKTLKIDIDSKFSIPLILTYKLDDYTVCFRSYLNKKLILKERGQIIDSVYLHSHIQNLPKIVKDKVEHELNSFVKLNKYALNIKSADLTKNKVDFEVKSYTEKIIGNQNDFFIDDSLKLLLKKTIASNKTPKYYILNFFGYWCKPCMEEMPEIIKIEKESLTKNYSVFNIECEIKTVKQLGDPSKLKYLVNHRENIITKNRTGFIKFFNVWQYPHFAIIAGSGKVINNNVKSIVELKRYISEN